MTVSDLMEQLKQAPPDAVLCVAELDEAFAANVAAVEIIKDAAVSGRRADGTEAVELAHGQDKAVVIRW